MSALPSPAGGPATAPPQAPPPVGSVEALRGPLHLVVVRTPGPAPQDRRIPVPLLLPGRPLRPAPPPGPRPRLDDRVRQAATEPGFGPELTRRTDLPEASAAGRRLVTVVLEAFAGRRPMTQLRQVVTPALFAALDSGRRPRWCAQGTAPVLVTSVRACEPVDGVAEISAVARRAGRAHAVAARLEGIDGRWRCTALQVG